MTARSSLTVHLQGEAETIRLGEDLALALGVGDCLALSGDLGAGKSTLARALLRALADDPDLEVPSPTFTLVQAYELRIPAAHFDLYRLADSSELDELGFDEALTNGICLVEWPEMAEERLPENRITLRLDHDGQGRKAMITADDGKISRICRVLAIRDFLVAHGLADATRRFLTGDASTRAYEKIHAADGSTLILMDWPPLPEGPAVLDGKPYPKVAHLAEDARPFVAISDYLIGLGLVAPRVFHVNYGAGILLTEDLGSEGILDDEGQPIPARYRETAACLAFLHGQKMARDLPVRCDIRPLGPHRIPDFDPTAMKMEARLLLDWHLPWKRGKEAGGEERQAYLAIWDGLIGELADAETHILLRDLHSPNVIWQDSEQGVRQVGLIDFQDAMIGPTAYDLASLIQDARVDIPDELAGDMMADYLALRRTSPGFDEQKFEKAFAIMAAQRNCKLAGLWVRLKSRDGKPGYMKHMPRTLKNLEIALRHAALAPLREWCETAGVEFSES